MLHSLQEIILRSRGKVLIMMSVSIRVDKIIIGLIFWNFVGMLFNVYLGYLELAIENNAM
jgi:hypothetical protein